MKLEQIKSTFFEHKPKPIGSHRFFSVLIPFVEVDGKANLLFEVRSRNMVSQPGEVCFPGGQVEKGETFLDAAVRETYEEIGIEKDKIQIIGKGDVLFGYANYTLYSYLGIISYEDYCHATLSKDEVDEIFLVDIDKFVKSSPEIYNEKVVTEIESNFPYEKIGIGEDYPWRIGKWEIPVYEVDNRIIWGLTGRLVNELIDTIFKK